MKGSKNNEDLMLRNCFAFVTGCCWKGILKNGSGIFAKADATLRALESCLGETAGHQLPSINYRFTFSSFVMIVRARKR